MIGENFMKTKSPGLVATDLIKPHQMKLKVCGMRSPDNILALSQLAPTTWVIFGNTLKGLSIPHPHLPAIKKTGVFVNASLDYIKDIATQHQLQTLQLHGSEALILSKTKTTELEIIKGFGVGSNFDFSVLKPMNLFVIIFCSTPKVNYLGAKVV